MNMLERITSKAVHFETISLIVTGPVPKPAEVFTNGCFDVLHEGHVRYLRRGPFLKTIS